LLYNPALTPLKNFNDSREYIALILSFFIIAFEALIRIVTLALPRSVIQWFYNHSRRLFHKYSGRTPPSEEKRFVERLRCARNFEELCRLHGYKMESHVVETRDGYMLGLHRIPNKKGESARQSGGKKPVVYLHHGLLMNSEVWVCLPDAEKNIPFVLAEKGYDVWVSPSSTLLTILLTPLSLHLDGQQQRKQIL
jgi:lysosomal acid lipase/cholesteryl ester hydrolase